MADGGGRDRDRIADPWGRRTPYGAGQAWRRSGRPAGRRRRGRGEVEAERWVPSACVLCSNGCGLDIGVAGDRIVGVRGRAGDRVNHGRLGPKGLYGWQANGAADRLLHPWSATAARLVETGWDQAMERIVERSRALLKPRAAAPSASTPPGQLFSEVLHAGGDREGAGSAPRTWTATPGCARPPRRPGPQGELRLRRPARLLHRRRRRRHPLPGRPQRRRHPDGAVVADAGPPPRTRPARPGGGGPAGSRAGPRGRPAPGRARRHQPGPAPAPSSTSCSWVVMSTATGWRPTPTRIEVERTVADWPPERATEVCGVPAAQIESGPDPGRRRAAAVHRPPGRLPVQPGHRGRLPGQQPAPAAGHAGPAGLRGAADERPAHHQVPRVRRRRRPPRLPQLAQPGPHRRAGPALERRPHDHPPLGAPTRAMQIWRYAEQGSIKLLWISGTNPDVSCPSWPASGPSWRPMSRSWSSRTPS